MSWIPAALLAGLCFAFDDPSAFPSASLHGDTGLVFIPTVEVVGDGVVSASVTQIPAPYNPEGFHASTDRVFALRVGLLPRLEITARVTQVENIPFVSASYGDDKDRMVAARILVADQGGWRPALAIGVRDPIGDSRRFHATYAVLRWSAPERSLIRAHLHCGWAPRLFRAASRALDGPFGAIEVGGAGTWCTALEHDGDRLNASLGFRALGGRAAIKAVFPGLDSVGGVLSLSLRLGNSRSDELQS